MDPILRHTINDAAFVIIEHPRQLAGELGAAFLLDQPAADRDARRHLPPQKGERVLIRGGTFICTTAQASW